MYIHLGQDTVVRSGELLGIFDLDRTTVSRATRDFLAEATARGEVVNVTAELPKSFVVTAARGGTRRVFISQLGPATLSRRARAMDK